MKLNRILDNYINDKKFSITYKDGKLDINNYTEIPSFSDTLIAIRYNDVLYHIEGQNLVIARMMDEEVLITGQIEKITKL